MGPQSGVRKCNPKRTAVHERYRSKNETMNGGRGENNGKAVRRKKERARGGAEMTDTKKAAT